MFFWKQKHLLLFAFGISRPNVIPLDMIFRRRQLLNSRICTRNLFVERKIICSSRILVGKTAGLIYITIKELLGKWFVLKKKITLSLHLLHRYILDSMLILSNQSIDSQLGIYKLLWLHCQKDIQVRQAWWLHQPQLMYEIELQGEDKFYIQ